MSLSGRQPNNPGYLEAQTYAGDPDNETAPSTLSHEKEIGIEAYTLATLADAVALTVNIPTADQKAALDAATTPSGSNALVTVVDLASYSSPTSTFYNFRTDTGVPASGEVKMDDADPTAATTLSFHNLNREGNNTSNAMLLINNGDAVIIQDATDGDKLYNFDVTGAPTQTGGTGASGYITYPVAFFAQGSTSLADADITVAALYPDGSSSAHLSILNNLSDLNNVVTARTNLGVDSSVEVDTKFTSGAYTMANKTLTSPDINTPDIDGGTIDGTTLGATNNIDGGALDTGTVVADALGAGSVTEAKIGSGAVTEAKIGSGAITEVKLGAGAVTADKIGSGAITDVKLATGIDGAKISAGTIPASAVEGGSLGGNPYVGAWNESALLGDNDAWNGIAYGEGIFVAVSQSGDRVARSVDNGITWSAITAAGDNDTWQDITYGNGVFVAVSTGTDVCMRSTDLGLTWTAISVLDNDENLYAIAYGNSLFIAVGTSVDSDWIVISDDDGLTWAVPTGTIPASLSLTGIAFGNDTFVATSTSGSNYIYSTDDGVNWASGTALAGSHLWRDVAFGNGFFVVVAANGSTNQAAYSADGITWTASTGYAASGEWWNVDYGNGTFIAGASAGASGQRSMISIDGGQTWQGRTIAGDNDDVWTMGYGGGAWIAMSNGANGTDLFARAVAGVEIP